jgi:hypothetical protein
MGDDFDASYAGIAPDLGATVASAQLASASAALDYVPAVLDETRQVAPAIATVSPQRFSGTASDGRSLGTLLYTAVTTAKSAIGNGLEVDEALAQGGRWLDMSVLSAVSDAGRAATAAEMTVRPKLGGWVRMLNPPSCSRCAVLAGKWYRWNTGFQRHRRCDCIHIPSSEDRAGDFTTDPYAYFHSLSPADQVKFFGKNDAQALHDGGDGKHGSTTPPPKSRSTTSTRSPKATGKRRST